MIRTEMVTAVATANRAHAQWSHGEGGGGYGFGTATDSDHGTWADDGYADDDAHGSLIEALNRTEGHAYPVRLVNEAPLIEDIEESSWAAEDNATSVVRARVTQLDEPPSGGWSGRGGHIELTSDQVNDLFDSWQSLDSGPGLRGSVVISQDGIRAIQEITPKK